MKSVCLVCASAIFLTVICGIVTGNDSYSFQWEIPSNWTAHQQITTEKVIKNGNSVLPASNILDCNWAYDSNGIWVEVWVTSGTGKGFFSDPKGVALDKNGNLYVADSSNSLTQKFDPSGKFLTQWGSYGSGNGQFSAPMGIVVDTNGNIYVADSGNDRIQKFTSIGAYVTQFGGSQGTNNDQFEYPTSIAVDTNDNVYVVDNDRIQVFTSTGDFVTRWGSMGTDNYSFSNPMGIAVDGKGNVYVADSANDRIEKFSPLSGMPPIQQELISAGVSQETGDIQPSPNGEFTTKNILDLVYDLVFLILLIGIFYEGYCFIRDKTNKKT
jgi:DNA-binding beta-propeller fold protein YncE